MYDPYVMKKCGAGIAVAGVFLMIAVGCSSSDDDSASGGNRGANAQVSGASADAVQVGMTEQAVRDLLGEPIRIFPAGSPERAGWLYTEGEGKELILTMANGQVVEVATRQVRANN